MNKIDAGAARAAQQPQGAWAAEGSQQVRRAITAHRNDVAVDTDVAPMMADLLARLDALTGPSAAPAILAAPKSPDPANPPSPQAALGALSTASGQLRELAKGAEVNDTTRQRLQSMIQVVDNHLSMKREVIMRAGSGQSR